MPAEYVRYPEKVVVATHAGAPDDMASTCPPVPAASEVKVSAAEV